MWSRRQWLASTLAAPAALAAAPRKSPELVVQLDTGETLKLSSLRGKVVCVEFLLTTCVHCKHCATLLQKLLDEYAPRGLTVVGAAVNRDARATPDRFADELRLRFPVGMSSTKTMLTYLEWYPEIRGGLPMMPHLVFIDRAGYIRAQHAGDSSFVAGNLEQNLREQIASLIVG